MAPSILIAKMAYSTDDISHEFDNNSHKNSDANKSPEFPGNKGVVQKELHPLHSWQTLWQSAILLSMSCPPGVDLQTLVQGFTWGPELRADQFVTGAGVTPVNN